MSRRARVLLPVLGFTLGCGGLWQEALSETFSVMTVDLEQQVPVSDERRDDVVALLEDGFVAAWDGHVGTMDVLPFSTAFDEAIADGKIDRGDLGLLKQRADRFDDVPIDPQRRADVLAMKQTLDARIRAERGGVAPPRGDLDEWELPDDLEAALNAASWPVDNCTEGREGGVRVVACAGLRGQRVATAAVTRGPKGTTLDVTVSDGDAAVALRDAIVPEGALLAELDATPLRRAVKSAGWSIERCDARREGRELLADCAAKDGARAATVTMSLQRGGRGRQQREVAAGVAIVLEGQSTLSVLVHDGAEADALAAKLLGR
jgi:hypothetical protein